MCVQYANYICLYVCDVVQYAKYVYMSVCLYARSLCLCAKHVRMSVCLGYILCALRIV